MLIRVVFAFMLLATALPSSEAKATVTKADISRAKSEIDLLKQDLQIKEAELRLMELQMARQTASAVQLSKDTPKPLTSANAAEPKPISQPVQLPPPLAPAPVAKHANVDPAPYLAAITQNIAMFRSDMSTKWLVLDEERVVFWVLDDEAYLVNLAVTCHGLLDAKKLKLENFSSRVRAGHDGVLFDDQRCQIESIAKLGGHSLPKPPKN